MGREARARSAVPGTVAILSSESPRSAAFCQAWTRVQLPPGTHVEWITGGPNIAHNRNLAVQALQGEWLWMLDDDMLMRPDTLTRLLAHVAHPEVAIVAPFCLKRVPPYTPVFATKTPTGMSPATPSPDARGLQPVAAIGTAGMLIRATVLETLPFPWFQVGRWHPVRLDEDYTFCAAAAEAGFQAFVDLDTPMGHITPFAIWPARNAEGWGPSYHAIFSTSSTQCVELMDKAVAEAYDGIFAPELRPPLTIGEAVPA